MIVKHPIEELLLIDAETKPNGELIGRDYCIIDLEHLQGKVFGDPIHEIVHSIKRGDEFLKSVHISERDDKFLTDKVPRSVLCQFDYKGKPVYPLDWMDESYQFLSDKEVQKSFLSHQDQKKLFRWSALERSLKVR